MQEAGAAAVAIDVGYFATGDFRTTPGTRASFVQAALAPGFALRGGRIVTERGAKRVRSFEVEGRRRPAVSTGMAEHFTLTRIHPGLREVNAYLGWFGRSSRLLQAGSLGWTAVARVPGARAGLAALARRYGGGSYGGPTDSTRPRSGSFVVAIARDSAGRPLAEARLRGIDGYEFTGNLLAWAAARVASGHVSGAGALGPVEAFGLERLEAGCAEAGMRRLPGSSLGSSPPSRHLARHD